jgi:hypothetical protein
MPIDSRDKGVDNLEILANQNYRFILAESRALQLEMVNTQVELIDRIIAKLATGKITIEDTDKMKADIVAIWKTHKAMFEDFKHEWGLHGKGVVCELKGSATLSRS